MLDRIWIHDYRSHWELMERFGLSGSLDVDGIWDSGSVRFEFVPSNSVGPNRWISNRTEVARCEEGGTLWIHVDGMHFKEEGGIRRHNFALWNSPGFLGMQSSENYGW